MSNSIQRGDRIVVRDALGQELERVATTAVLPGDRFSVVFASRIEEWEAAREEGREPDSVPWPMSDVRLAEEEGAA